MKFSEFYKFDEFRCTNLAGFFPLVPGPGPGPRILHTRTWTDQLHGVEAWPAGERPALDVLHVSLVFAGTELLRVFGRTTARLEVELDLDRRVVTSETKSDSSPRSRPWMNRQVAFNVWQLVGSHVREVALLRSHGTGSSERVALCAQQMALVRGVLPDAVVKCSGCEGANLCRC
ncbi:uncharacterized protein LOC117644303 [Thrips palmi]|uniref:Uncharacterized protein LOC117644303 n=1 Tax=Thrips palmi TaxID=161013 RepID=A0A6P8YIB4_THRPL|nr:uncharacterized protein LOC117644303 [Thrips palmi]